MICKQVLHVQFIVSIVFTTVSSYKHYKTSQRICNSLKQYMRYMRYKRFAVTSAHVCTVVRRFDIHVYNIVIEQCFLMFTKLTLRLVSHGAAMNLCEISAINNNKTCYIIYVIYESTITGIYTSKALYMTYHMLW